jgi:hypothetical protein
MAAFPIVPVPLDASLRLEKVGSKEKFWYYRDDLAEDDDPGDDRPRPWLFKAIRPDKGEDWAEVVAARLCEYLGLPHAGYSLARWGETRGVVTRRLDDDRETLILGNVLLSGRDDAYPLVSGGGFLRLPQHTIGLVLETLDDPALNIGLPPDWPPPRGIVSASDLFVGYLLLDAYIGNTDRHDMNWAIIERLSTDDAHRYLSPTFDHASSLGRELTDEGREERLRSRDRGRQLPAYLGRTRSALFEDTTQKRPMHTHEAFWAGAARREAAGRLWLDRLGDLTDDAEARLLQQVPDSHIAPVGREFAAGVLAANRANLLNVP